MVSSEVAGLSAGLEGLDHKSGAEPMLSSSTPVACWLSPFPSAPLSGSSETVATVTVEEGTDTQSDLRPRSIFCCVATVTLASVGAIPERVKGLSYVGPYNRKVRFDFLAK